MVIAVRLGGKHTSGGGAYTGRMVFNADLARRHAKRRDRDVASFFAGREAEIASFEDAVEEADSRQAVFRVFQGAPGCGKTSLAVHLRETRKQGLVHVVLDERHLESYEALAAQVEAPQSRSGISHPLGTGSASGPATPTAHVTSAAGRSAPSSVCSVEGAGRQVTSGARKAAEVTVRLATAYLRAAPVGDTFGGTIARRGLDEATLVLYRDEAQTIDDASRKTLLTLHTVGLGVPTVCVFTGLSHTARRIKRLPGLSR